MKLGVIGLGRMGSGIALRLRDGGHEVLGFDTDPQVREEVGASGLSIASSLVDLLDGLGRPATLWLMLPEGEAVDNTLSLLRSKLEADATVIDGGNSNYEDSLRRSIDFAARRIAFLDVGTSGGILGRQNGYCMSVGGDPAVVDRLRPIFSTLAPGPDRGWRHVGPPGAGHFVKMVHNGIEYGLMQAYAEGFALLNAKEEMDLDLASIAQLWNEGSVIRSWLLELSAHALREDPSLEQSGSAVHDSGEGRWAVAEAVRLDVPAPVMTLSLINRLQSRDRRAFANRLLQAMRHSFGGHPVRKD